MRISEKVIYDKHKGEYVLETRKKIGHRLVRFCQEEKITISTGFQGNDSTKGSDQI